jgi:endonuclease IV
MDLLSRHPLIDGIEMCYSHYPSEIEVIKDYGLKCSIHNPMKKYGLSLNDYRFLQHFMFDHLLQADICRSNSPCVGFHLGYHFPDTQEELSNFYVDIKESTEVVKHNLASIEKIINYNRLNHIILFETPAYYHIDDWRIKQKYSNLNLSIKKVNQLIDDSGINTYYRSITSPWYIHTILSLFKSGSVGYLLDMAHTFCTAYTLTNQIGEINEESTHFENIFSLCKKRIYQLHFNVPENTYFGYVDRHNLAYKGDKISEIMFGLTELALKECPNIKMVTMEMKGSEPLEHAKNMIQQGELFYEKCIF